MPAVQIRQADHSPFELQAGETGGCRRGDLPAGAPGCAREADTSSAKVPSSAARCAWCTSCGLACDVEALGEQDQVVPLLSVSDLFLLAVGAGKLRAGRARSDGVRGARGGFAGRRPARGRRGRRVADCFADPEDIDGMARPRSACSAIPALHERFARAGLERVRRHFCAGRVVPQYEAYYQEVIRDAT